MGREWFCFCFTCRPQFERCRALLRTERGNAIAYFNPPTQHQNLSILYTLCTCCQTCKIWHRLWVYSFSLTIKQLPSSGSVPTCLTETHSKHNICFVLFFAAVRWNRLKFLKFHSLHAVTARVLQTIWPRPSWPIINMERGSDSAETLRSSPPRKGCL